MGLKVTTISRLPLDSNRDYFVYFLDYGWEDAYSRAMYDNFDRLAESIAGHRAVVIAGLHRTEFSNEVLSWHRINGEDAKELLPAILITDVRPQLMAESNSGPGAMIKSKSGPNFEHTLLLPLRDACDSPADVPVILKKIVDDIRSKRALRDWELHRVMKRGAPNLVDMVLLRPNVAGIGFDFMPLIQSGISAFAGRKKKK